MHPPTAQTHALRAKQGALIKQHREFRKLTQGQVAETIGVSKVAVSVWEKGKSSPVAVHQIALAKVLQVPWHILFGLDGEDVA
jgi:transcriptional regulator with XRE-family HTH domain